MGALLLSGAYGGRAGAGQPCAKALPLEGEGWVGMLYACGRSNRAQKPSLPGRGEESLHLRRLRTARASTAAAAVAPGAAGVLPTGALLESTGLAAAMTATLAFGLARLDPGFTARVALSFGARVAARGLTPAAAARVAARSADRLDVLGDDRDFLAKALRKRNLVERHFGQPLDVAQVVALVLGAEADCN